MKLQKHGSYISYKATNGIFKTFLSGKKPEDLKITLTTSSGLFSQTLHRAQRAKNTLHNCVKYMLFTFNILHTVYAPLAAARQAG